MGERFIAWKVDISWMTSTINWLKDQGISRERLLLLLDSDVVKMRPALG